MNTHTTRQLFKTLGLTLISATTLMACDRNEKIDESTAHLTLDQNITAMSDTMVKTLVPFEQSEAFGVEGDEVFGAGTSCSGQYNPSTDSYDEVCEDIEAPDFEAQVVSSRDQLINVLNDYVFRDDQIEEQKRREITYLMKGKNLCKDSIAQVESYNKCVTRVDDAQIRLVVTSPEEGDIDIDLFLGENKRYNPGLLNVWRDRIAVEGDLQNIKQSAKFISNIVGERFPEDFPDTFEGRFSVEMSKSGARHMAMSASVLNAITIADASDGYDISVASASPALSFSADGTLKTLSAEAQLGAVHVKFPESHSEYKDLYDAMGNWTGEEQIQSEYVYDFAMAGMKGKSTFDVEGEKIIITGASLGNGPLTFDVDSKRVFSMDLDKAVNATITEPTEGSVKFDISPATLNMDFSFKNLMEKMEEFGADDWMLDEQLQIVVSGDAPSFLFDVDADQLKAVAGKLLIKATQRNVEIAVEGNQCLIDGDGASTPLVPCSDDSCTGGQPPVEEVPYDAHPFAYLEAATCK